MDKYMVEVDLFGSRYRLHNGKLSDDKDFSIEYFCGDKWWYLNEEPHRTDGPAVITVEGHTYWYIKGKDVTLEQSYDYVNIMEVNPFGYCL